MKKALSIILAALLCGMTMSSCGDLEDIIGGDSASERPTTSVNTDETQLYVFNYDGGIGSDWIYEVVERFEEEYADVCFEPGTNKKGVQVIVEANKDDTHSTASIATQTADVIFTEMVWYNDLVSQGVIMDITDIVQEEDENGVSIEDRLPESTREALTALTGKYYALPHYEAFRGINYDIDLFENRMLYFAENRDNGNGGFIVSKSDVRSAGPDGKSGTSDDGLPATMEEFFELCDYMLSMGITPFVFTGQYNGYTVYPVEMIFARYSGGDAVRYDYSFDSNGETVEIVTGFSETEQDYFGPKPIVEEVVITPENGYLLKQQLGKYSGLAFLEKILSNSQYYTSLSINTTYSHLDAQEDFIYSSLENRPIAMLIDGSYWVNEAETSGAFERSIEDFGSRAENRNFGWFPLPGVVEGEVTEENAAKNAVKDMLNSYAFINANIADNEPRLTLAKLFLKYCYQLENLQKFTEITGSARGLNYDLTEENLAQMSTYQRSIWEMRQEADVIKQISASPIFINNESSLIDTYWTSTARGQSYWYPYLAFRSGVSAWEYFNGMQISPVTWERNYSEWF